MQNGNKSGGGGGGRMEKNCDENWMRKDKFLTCKNTITVTAMFNSNKWMDEWIVDNRNK